MSLKIKFSFYFYIMNNRSLFFIFKTFHSIKPKKYAIDQKSRRFL